MTYPFQLEFEEVLPGFNIGPNQSKPTPLYPTAMCVINEQPQIPLKDRVIQDSQAWDITFYWRVWGVVSNAITPDHWDCNIYLLRLDKPGVWSKTQPLAYSVATPGPDDYMKQITVPPSNTAGGVPLGVYKLHTSVDLIGTGIYPVTMVGEGPVMKFYKP